MHFIQVDPMQRNVTVNLGTDNKTSNFKVFFQSYKTLNNIIMKVYHYLFKKLKQLQKTMH